MQSRYVCAFRGRRDYYEVPLALAEAGKLDQFVTNAYLTGAVARAERLFPAGMRDRWAYRFRSGIPKEKVRCLWGTAARENIRHAFGISEQQTYAELDNHYSIAARDRARKTKSSLLLYHPYAWEAFTASYSHQPYRVLFQFHPHADFEERLLESDRCAHPELQGNTGEGRNITRQACRRDRDCWPHADLVICASSFTKQTLIEAGAEPGLCRVIPYGIDIPPLSKPEKTPDRFEVLFVGSGVRRKGLHHLLQAWDAAKLPSGSRLTLVCRDLEPWVEKRVHESGNVRLIRGVTASELSHLYRVSTLFAMPSLVEGFGHVYLEALAAGCPVLGTTHTGLPDLGTEQDGIFLTPAGEIDALIQTLERLAEMLTANVEIGGRARACAERFPSARFREGVINALQNSERAEDDVAGKIERSVSSFPIASLSDN